MPGFDGTGPRGQGAMTGGGRGYCAMPVGEARIQLGRGVSGARDGRGRRNCFYATGLPGWVRAERGMQAFGEVSRTLSKEDELSALKSQVEYLKGELDAVQARVQDLESK
ncbi:MAG: hypothetical protein BWY16_00382 [Candidatus Omnitrophica bacterium ADurb.Bin205]|nr:MAG: hypothetical protein BWY16_00382 [Candidatus Omnitrophica bacterium ADurb.Bin205]